LVWVALAFGIAVAAAIPFDRFDPARWKPRAARRERRRGRKRGCGMAASEDTPATGAPAITAAPGAAAAKAAAPPHITPLVPEALRASPLSRFAACVDAEVKLTLRGTSRWWYVAWLVIAGFAIGLPLETARAHVMPLLWIWPVLLWSPLGTRERRHGTDQILFSAPHPLGVQLAATWAPGAYVAMAAGAPMAVRLAVAGDPGGLFAWLVGAAFIPALAIALGVWTGTSRTFEAVYTMLWYAGPLQPIPSLDFMGASRAAVERGMPVVYLVITVLLLTAATIGRRRQLRG
jgi:hypothetical protein